MQIVVNTRLLLKNRLDGMGWFAFQTLKRITQNNKDVHFVFLFDRPFDEQFIFSENITPIVLSPQARHPFLYYMWFEFSLKQILNKLQPDLFLSPDGFLSLGSRCKQMPVIHDINFLHYPRDSKWLTAKYYNYFFPRYAKKATRIATVSEFSKSEIISNYQIESSVIDVVYNGIHSFFKPIDDNVKQLTKEKYTKGNDYFVSVGSLHPRKNTVNLIKAFSLFKLQSKSSLKLVLAGPKLWGQHEMEKIIEQNALTNEIVFTGRLEDDELAKVLGSALALTFVPYYEGFGIPLVEAMQAKVPIITSNVTSLPEVVGDAALLVNPFDVEQIKNAMMELYQHQETRIKLVEKGSQQKQKFSWDISSNLLWESCIKAIKEN